jgi:hypothetical protein
MPKKPTKPKPPEPPKALAKTHGPRPRVDGPSVARATGKALVDAIPVFGKLVGAVADAETRTRVRRLKTWSAYIQGGDDDDSTFVAQLTQALQGDEADQVRSAILESAKAAHEAVNEDVLPSIGRLTRRFLIERVPHRRLYRSVLELLQRLDAEEFRGLRHAMNHLAAIPSLERFHTRITQEHAAASWHWICQHTNVPLIVGDSAPQVVRALMGIVNEPPLADLTRPESAGSTLFLPMSLVALLASVTGVDAG